jgi:hypothetical protein
VILLYIPQNAKGASSIKRKTTIVLRNLSEAVSAKFNIVKKAAVIIPKNEKIICFTPLLAGEIFELSAEKTKTIPMTNSF